MATQVFNSSYTGAEIEEKLNQVANLFNLIYPIGSIYMSVNSTSPATLFGGTWEQIQNRFLLCAGSSYTAGSTGGSATHTPSGSVGGHTLTTSETPSHTHTRGTMNITGGAAPAHSSGVCWYNVTGTSGAFYTYESVGNCGNPSISACFTGDHMLGFDASRNWTGETSSVGGGASHNHGFTGTSQNTMPPYLAVYVWKRTA